MRFLRTNTAIRLTVGPFLDKTDGITPETALTVTNDHLTLMVDDGNVPTLVLDASATASGGNNDMVHVTNDDAGFYDLELTADNLNYLGRAMLAITDAANHCPVFHEFMILPAMIYDSLVLGTDRFDANVTHVVDVAATNLAAMFSDAAGAVPWLGIIDQGTAQSATGTTVVLRSAAAFGNSTLIGATIQVLGSDQGYWQRRVITANVGSTDTVTVDTWDVTPSGTITYKIFGTPPAPASGTLPAVNVAQLGGDSTAADNAESFFDGTGYAGTNNVIPTVTLVNTLTTYTGNTPQTGDAYGLLTTAVADSIPADGTRPSPVQALYMLTQGFFEGSISGTTWTIKKVDGTTTLFTVTLNDATTPTSKTRAT